MPKFIPHDPNQSKMVVINYADQLQPGTFEFAINHALIGVREQFPLVLETIAL